MSRRDKVLAAVCIALHVLVLWNVWQADKLTPRIVRIDACEFNK